MPGVCAIVRPDGQDVTTVVSAMRRRMSHFLWLGSREQGRPAEGVGLGVVALTERLAGATATNADGGATVLLDGEIYDGAAERRRLESRGVRFAGSGSAELLLEGWLAEGTAFLARLHGLFTALVWNQATRELAVITDRFGMRPVYMASPPGAFVVASEIKAVLAAPGVNRQSSDRGIAQFFSFGHFFNDDTLFAGIRALPPATCLVYRASDGRIQETQFVKQSPSRPAAGGDDLAAALDDHLVAATARRAAPGEKLGLSLSGGLDARTILGVAPSGLDLTTVSLGVKGSIDHRGAARLSALAGVPHHEYFLDASFLDSFEVHLREMVRLTDGHYLDQGIVMATLPMYRDLGIEFLIRGHAGELLHMRKAYAYSLDDDALRASEADLETWLMRRLSAYMIEGVPPDLFTINTRALALASLRDALARTPAPGGAPVDRVWPLFVAQRLHRETALSMHKFGCFATVRLPYLDNDVVATLLAMPARMKLGGDLQHRILDHRRPDFLSVVNSNTGARMGAGQIETGLAQLRLRVYAKLGLPGYQPYERLGLWLRRELRPFAERTLFADRFLGQGLFRPEVVKTVVAQHMSGQANHTFLLMAMIVFAIGQETVLSANGDA
jgi:asparagine synthase (glutamine-hydrolysing)